MNRKQGSNSPTIERRRATVSPPRYEAILVGRSISFTESIARILDNTQFHVAAREVDMDRLGSGDMGRQETVLLVLDARHGLESAVRQVEAFRRLHAEARIVAVTGATRTADIGSLLQAGANACLADDVPVANFLKSLEPVMLGETLVPMSMLFEPRKAEGQGPEQPARGRLSSQESRILEGLVEGHPNKVIARELGTAEATIKVHVKSILRKLGVSNRTQAAIWAMRSGGRGSTTETGILAENRPTRLEVSALA